MSKPSDKEDLALKDMVLAELRKALIDNPSLRTGQLLSVAVGTENLFYVSDAQLYDRLRRFKYRR